jgi:hypothetical protein
VPAMANEDPSLVWKQRLPYLFAIVVVGGLIAIASSSTGKTDPLGWVILVLVPTGFAVVLVRQVRQSRRARPVRDAALADSVSAEFPRVWVQLNPRSSKSVSLKGGPFGVEVLVKTHSFEIGPRPPLRGSFRYYFGAAETTMQLSRERFSNFWVRDCILVSGSYGGEDMRIALYAKDQLPQLWSALAHAGVQALSGPPAGAW